MLQLRVRPRATLVQEQLCREFPRGNMFLRQLVLTECF